jgi:mycothiol synthase
MNLTLRPWTPSDRDTLAALVNDPSIAPQFDKFLGAHGLEHKLADPRLEKNGLTLAFVDGVPAGFGVVWSLPNPGQRWTMLRVAVLERFRRRGVGRRLAGALLAFADAHRAGEPAEAAGSAWLPNEAAEALAASLEMNHERWFWLMERPRGGMPEPAWPAGVTTRAFDGSEDMLRDWTDVYNDSFAHHFRFVPSGVEIARALTADPTFRADGLLLAYRDGAVAGFCRNELHESRGEIGTLGVAEAARGIGLGRALLRWGVGWLERNTSTRVTLLVDGENENALGLYRSEGFAVARTRRIWTRALPPA